MFKMGMLLLQVKLLNKLASARASGLGGGSKVLTDLVEGLEEPEIAVELRLKINQTHADLKGRYVSALHYNLSLFFLLSVTPITVHTHCRSFREYGEAVLKHLENSIDLDPKLRKAPVNYEGVRSLLLLPTFVL